MLKTFLKYLRQKLFKGHREKFLSIKFFKIITNQHKKKNIRILDFGSGFKPEIALYLSKKFKNKGIMPIFIVMTFIQKKI